jgi:hypothetical protein
VADEEKESEKNQSDKKDKKDFILFATFSFGFSDKIDTAFRLAEKIQPSPCLEKPTPPPNFC